MTEYNITMSLNDTLELDTIIKNSTIASDPVTIIDGSNYDSSTAKVYKNGNFMESTLFSTIDNKDKMYIGS